MWESNLRLQRVAQRFGAAGQVVQDPLPVTLFIVRGARIDVLDAVPQPVPPASLYLRLQY
jgi:hypothetical protein